MITDKKNYKPVNTPLVFQIECTECGAASLSMIMQYYGVHIPMEQLRIDTGVSRDGCRASKILQGARKYNFYAQGKKMDLEALFQTKPPCIIHWNFNHFVVYEGKRGKFVYLNDPAVGKRKITVAELDEGFTGITLLIYPTKKVEKTRKLNSLTVFLFSKIKNYYIDTTYLFLLGLLLIFPGVFIPILSKFFIDDILINRASAKATNVLITMLFLIIMQVTLTLYRNYIVIRLQTKMSLLSSFKLIKHMLGLPINFFYQRASGDLVDRIESNNRINEFIAGELITNQLNLLMAFFYMIVLFFYNGWLTLIVTCILLINIFMIKLVSKNLSKTILKVQQDQGKLISVIYSGIRIMQTIKAAGIENKYVSRILGYYTKYIEGKHKNTRLQHILNVFPNIFRQICDVIILIIGGCFIIQGNLTIGGLVAYSTLFNAFIRPINEFISFTETMQTINADRNRVEDIMNYGCITSDKTEVAFADYHKKLSGKVVMKQVTFGYNLLDPPLIKDFNFTLEPGKSIALVGGSGSGKSTIAKILSGLYKEWSGEVLYDNMKLAAISHEVKANSIATVSQEISLFSGSIRDNITLWNESIREEEIIRAAKDALIHDVINQKPQAYDFHLEEGGRNISGGQRQRLEIARALAMNPSILIMDEATSALDPLTEKEIIYNIKRRGCSCIIVAHRLSAIRDCDEIIVLQNGEIIQRGTHEELAACEGKYRDLFAAQK